MKMGKHSWLMMAGCVRRDRASFETEYKVQVFGQLFRSGDQIAVFPLEFHIFAGFQAIRPMLFSPRVDIPKLGCAHGP